MEYGLQWTSANHWPQTEKGDTRIFQSSLVEFLDSHTEVEI